MMPALSYRVKIPLALCFISLLTAAVLLSVFAVSAYRSLHQHLLDLAEDVGSALAPSLAGPLQHDDLWQAYVILSDTQSAFTPLLVVLDAQQRIFASNQPRELPLLNRLDETDARYRALAGWFGAPGRIVESYTDHQLNRVFTVTPVTQSDIQVGQLIVGYPLQWLHERFLALAWQAAWTTLAVTAIIMLLGVLWARHMTAPLMTITDAMDRLEDDDPVVGSLPDSDDEVGRLSRRFRLLVKDLKLKRQLKNRCWQANVWRQSAG
jgi:hypothetical protein